MMKHRSVLNYVVWGGKGRMEMALCFALLILPALALYSEALPGKLREDSQKLLGVVKDDLGVRWTV